MYEEFFKCVSKSSDIGLSSRETWTKLAEKLSLGNVGIFTCTQFYFFIIFFQINLNLPKWNKSVYFRVCQICTFL